MEKFYSNLRALGAVRLAMLGGIGLAVLVAVALVAGVGLRPQMTTIYSGLDPAEAGRVVAEIEGMGIPVSVGFDGSVVSAPAADVARIRMALAEKGLPAAGGIGYELFDGENGLGLTSFMQRMNRLRAMEGELSRTVQTLSGVAAARVHLVLPDREAFSSTAPTPTASVVVRMRGAAPLERSRAHAIRHLVSSSVPGLSPTAVTVLDASGEVLLSEDSGSMGEATSGGSRASFEARMVRNVEKMLAARLGPGNVRVQVSAEMDLRREVTRSRRFDPDGRVIRSTQTVEERQKSTDGEADMPTTVEQNLPEAALLSGTTGAGNSSSSERTEETVNYEISTVESEVVREPGELKRMSVAVLVNEAPVTDANGEVTWQARTPEELEAIGNLVRSAVGYDEGRGDVVAVESLRFVDLALSTEFPEPSFGDMISQNLGTILKWTVLAVLAGMLILFVLRPLVGRVAAAGEPEVVAGAQASGTAAAGATDSSSQEAAENGEGAEAGEAGSAGGSQPITIPSRGDEDVLAQMRSAVDAAPDEALAAVRAWLRE